MTMVLVVPLKTAETVATEGNLYRINPYGIIDRNPLSGEWN
jgi:hypothetical protein